MKALNYKVGALKRKYNLGKGDFAPGTLINHINAQKAAESKAPTSITRIEKVAIMGLV